MKLKKESNREVIKELYKNGYNMKEISLLTNNSVLAIIKCLKLKKSI